MSDAPAAPPPGAAPAGNANRWWTLGAVCVATFMLLLDITIVNVALPDIGRTLDAGFDDLQWVVDAYALSLAAFTLTSGSLADRFGRRRLFVAGLAVFTAASVLCGLAGTPLMLILARGLQGVGGAAMFATSLALLAATFHGKDRGLAFGLWGATTGGAVAIGPLVGGVLVDWIGWEAIFFVNIPIGVLAILVAQRRVAESRNPHATQIDVPGLITFAVGLFALVYALVRGNAEGWSSGPIAGALVLAVAMLLAFVVFEWRTPAPMFDLHLLRKPAFTGAQIAAFTLAASMFAMFLYLTLYIQNGLGYSPLEAGLRFLPVTLLSFVVAPISGRLSAVVPTRWLMGGGLLFVGVGLLLMRGLDAGSAWTALLLGFMVAGAGIGLVNPPLASTAVGVVEPARAGVASGINSTMRQVGLATGVASLGALFQHRLDTHLASALRAAGPQVEAAARGVPDGLFATGSAGPLARIPGGREAVLTGFTSALDEILLVAGIVALVGAVLVMLLVRPRDFVAPPGEPGVGSGG